MVRYLYDDFVKTPQTEEEWVNKFKSFMENYEFHFVGALGGLHAHVWTHLKNHFNLKNKYTIRSIGLIGHNKRFLHLIGIRGIIHDASLPQYSKLFQESRRGSIILNKHINVRDAGEIPIVTTIGDSAFQRLRWLIKGFNQNTRDQKERFFEQKLCSTRVVSENAYRMLNGHWRLLYKKCGCNLYSSKNMS